jgi:hypothetical protein
MAVKTKSMKTKKTSGRNGRPTIGTEDIFYKFGGAPKRAEHGWLEYSAKQFLDLPVKQRHIDDGLPKSPTECIMAIAGSDYFDDKYVIEVGCTLFRVIDDAKKKRLTFMIPAALRNRLRLFDKLTYWNLPPALYRLFPMSRKKKNKKTGLTGSTHSSGGTLVIGGRPRSKRKKISSPTRIISRGRILAFKPAKMKKSVLKKSKRSA